MRVSSWFWVISFPFVAFTPGEADISAWKLGGSGLAWSGNDTVQVLIDFETAPGAIQPLYLTKEQNLFARLSNWSPIKEPRELGYVDGTRPRIWVAADGFFWFQRAGILVNLWVDGDSTTYVPPGSLSSDSEWYTIDVGVPVPVDQFGFFTPPRGLTSDGRLLSEDIYDAFEISVSEETDPVMTTEKLDGDYHPLETLIVRRPQNFDAHVRIDFPKQYVRFVRFKRIITERTRGSGVRLGTIGDFELWAKGVPKRVLYTTKVLELDQEVNFGRVFWAATPMRLVDGQAVEAPDARASVKMEMRSGRDADPNVYHEFTDSGEEVVVSRERFERELKPPDIDRTSVIQEGKPGLRAAVVYDTDNWTFWSFPIVEPGTQIPLERGRHLQLKLSLESQSFDDFTRLDSLWIEVSSLLAQRVAGEVARLDEPLPAGGLTRVELGETTDFSYDIKADFESAAQGGFDAVRIRTGSHPRFSSLKMGTPLLQVEAARVEEDDEGLTVFLSERITRSNSPPLRLVFATEVFVFANTFEGEVFNSGRDDLPQRIEVGDVSRAVSTNSLKVWGASDRVEQVIGDLRFSSEVITPNGDGINDELRVDYSLFRLPEAVPVELSIYRLDGTRAAHFDVGRQGAGLQRATWNGRGADGRRLVPGLYLLDLSLKAEFETIRHLRPLSVAY